jgi:hypothetical protein
MGLGSGIRDPVKTYPGSRGQKGTGSRIWIRNTGSGINLYPDIIRNRDTRYSLAVLHMRIRIRIKVKSRIRLHTKLLK